MSDLMADKTVEFLREAANYFANRPTNGEDRAYWANVYNSEKCVKAADEIEATRKDYALLQEKYDEQVVEIDRLREVLRINTEQQAEHIKTLLESWEKERKILTDEIAKLRKQASDASWTAEMYRDQIDDRPKW